MVQIHSPQPFLLGSLTTHEKAEERMVQDQEVSGSIRLAPDSVKSPFQLVFSRDCFRFFNSKIVQTCPPTDP